MPSPAVHPEVPSAVSTASPSVDARVRGRCAGRDVDRTAATRATPARAPAAVSVLVAAILVTYAGAFTASYQFDDFAAILASPATQGLADWWRALPGIRPLLKFSFALTGELGGGAIAVHATNVALHAINACLVWALLRRWLPALSPSSARTDLAALLAALLFALHPAATEAVTYASGRSISLSATFTLAALLAEDASRTSPRRAPAWLGPMLFALALAVRETAVVVPALPLLRAWATGHPLRAELWRLRRYALVVAAAASVASLTPGYHRFFGVSLDTRPFLEQAMGQLLAHGYLLTHPLLGLCNIDPDLRVPSSAWSPTLAACALLLAALLATMLRARRRQPWLAFAIGWYFLLLAPANSLLPRLDLANDRHLYLALAGPALAVASVLARIRARPAARVVACAGALALCTAALVATRQRNADYRSETSLWQATVRDSPQKARAWLNLGYAHRLAGDVPRAAAAYRCALALEPANVQAAINLDLAAPDDTATGSCPDPRPAAP